MSRLDTLLSSGVVAVMRKLPAEDVEEIAQALVDGGVSGLEVTVDSEDAFGAIRRLREKFGEEVVIGAGTVLDSETAVVAIEGGAEFIFAPTLSEGTIRAAKRYGKIVIPGVFTPTEALQATEWGADVVKVFPADSVGPGFIKAVNGPLGQIKMMPTGGVDLDTIESFIKAGAVAVGAGGSLLDKSLIAAKDWNGLREHAVRFVEKVKESRKA
ncbi:bifunctional 4-hydroxy-2-oxoglutarate aldolase/2-dehydro-3-deoxy-phosphogluconate aldolase [Shouchella shacheensis]|uniref:bifunctional 4-hydroxy-2-oxoglutarate aldolase/2-dehydro-3-deoxy-phosphogluconate aldolase n=1 Tax=Shouchella shacheensis TaxID=1649580 RepID=UPI00073FBFAD|nr:bifunctional 4-hydroxy-2-oxoglutarate aldolase/2-dehydro-3-deoxy-phosphogluconate aldolase [Shouchella shacheensis]